MDDNSVDTTSQEQWPWRLALDSIPPPLIILRPTGEIIEANAPLCLLLGLRRNELLAQSWPRFFPHASLALEAMLVAIAQKQVGASVLEATLRRWDETEYPVSLTLRPPRRGQDQGKDHVLCTITSAGQLERQSRLSLIDSDLSLTAIMDHQALDSFLQGLALCDESGRIHEINEILCAMLGYHRQLLRQGTFSWPELAPLAKRADLHQKVQACLLGQGEPTFEIELQDAAGGVLPVLLTCHALDSSTQTNQKLFFMTATDLRPVKAEQALRELRLVEETESFWRHLFENLTEGLGIFGMHGRIFVANQALFDLTGYTQRDIEQGLSWYQVVAPDCLERVVQRAHDVLERVKGPVIPLAADLLDVHGNRVPVLLRGSALPPSAKGEARIAVSFVNANALSQQEMALVKERSYWNDIVSAVSDAILVIGADQRVHEANPAACSLLGLNRQQLDDGSWVLDLQRHVLPADQEHVLTALRGCMAGEEMSGIETTLVDAQGMQRPVLMQGRLLTTQPAWLEQEQEPHMVLVITDISAIKARENEMAQTMGYWHAIFDTTQDAMAVLSMDGCIHEANPAFMSLFIAEARLQEENSMLPSWHMLVPEHCLAETLQEAQRVLDRDAGAQRHALEIQVKAIDGRPLTVLVRGERLERLPEWPQDRFVVSLVDITQLKAQAREIEHKNQALEEASKAKSDFLAVMSHELRTPLNAIIGFSEMLRDGVLEGPLLDEQRDAAQEILKAGQHMLSLVNDILDLSKVTAGRMELQPSMLDPGHILAATVASIQELARQKNIQLTLNFDETLPSCLLDGRRFQQMILNYLANALKFTAEGSVTVTARVTDRSSILQHPGCIEAASLSTADHFLEVCVADTGIGIAPEHHTRLFRRFEQVDSTLSRQYQGTGLGLALVKSLAELQGGAVGLISSPGVGSQFYFWVPAVESNAILPHDSPNGFPAST